jgi:hypothetical protein
MRFGLGIPYAVVRTAAGWVGRCLRPACCTDVLPSSPLTVGTGLGEDPWIADDRTWFAAHPGRTWRLRQPMPGELEALATDEALAEQAHPRQEVTDDARRVLQLREQGAPIAVAVCQYTPGLRVRMPFEFATSDPLESYTDAAVPALAPELAELAAQHRALATDAAMRAAADAVSRRRLEAVGRLVKSFATHE